MTLSQWLSQFKHGKPYFDALAKLREATGLSRQQLANIREGANTSVPAAIAIWKATDGRVNPRETAHALEWDLLDGYYADRDGVDVPTKANGKTKATVAQRTWANGGKAPPKAVAKKSAKA